jgi:transposase
MSLVASDPLAELEELRALTAQLQAELYAKNLYIEKLKAQLATLKRARFGRSSEKLDRLIEQLELTITDLEEEEAQADVQQTQDRSSVTPPTLAGKTKPALGRKPLPDHLPSETITHPPVCSCPNCGGTVFSKIGTDEREVLEYVPSHFKRVVHLRPKMSCRACETIVQAPMPSLPIERGRPGPNLLAHVLVSKYCDHLPLHRQSDIYAREGIDLDRSTLAGWVGAMAALLKILSDRIGAHVRAGETVHADDTPVPVLDPGRGKTKTGRLWTVVRDERPWGSTAPPAAFYAYSPDRKGERAHQLLSDCRGFLHADAYAGFDKLYEGDELTGQARLTQVTCWAHARRDLYNEFLRNRSPAAERALNLISQLFAIEAEVNGSDPQMRLATRQAKSVPVLDTLKRHLDATLARISGKSEFAKAIRYITSRWQAFTVYATDGRLEMSNNAAERAIRPLALGRKNYLFSGSDAGGERAAVIYTIVETCKMGGINPHAYLADIINRIADHPANRIDELLPWNWSTQS